MPLNRLVEPIVVGERMVEIRHVIRLNHSRPTNGAAALPAQIRRLSRDGVPAAPWPASALQHGGDRAFQPRVAVAGDQLDAA
jgi:hypothetical protein